ncbi:MAG: NblA/ycf18 family protein [Cyanobacteria bacterium P01_G01_bin.19]
MDYESNELSLEQEFMHEVFAAKIQNLSCEETKALLVKFHKQMLFKDNFYKKLFRKQRRRSSSN